MLDKLQTVENVLHKSVFPKEEIVSDIQELIRDGFVAISGADTAVQAAEATGSHGKLNLDDEIIVSEAKFLLTDFAVDKPAANMRFSRSGTWATQGNATATAAAADPDKGSAGNQLNNGNGQGRGTGGG